MQYNLSVVAEVASGAKSLRAIPSLVTCSGFLYLPHSCWWMLTNVAKALHHSVTPLTPRLISLSCTWHLQFVPKLSLVPSSRAIYVEITLPIS